MPSSESTDIRPDQGPHAQGEGERWDRIAWTAGTIRHLAVSIAKLRPDVSVLHSMQHGAVGIHYEPSLEPARHVLLEDVARSIGDEVIFVPRSDMANEVVLIAWTKRLALEEVDDTAIRASVAEHANRSPEGAAPCLFQVDEAV